MANACPRRAFRWTRTASLLLAGLLAAAPALAESPVESFNTQYRLKAAGFPFTVGAQRTLSKAGGERWEMEVSASNFLGEIRETSVFTWQGCLPVTHYYGYHREGLGRVKAAELRIADKQATSERTDHEPYRYAVDQPATDKIALTLALQCRLARGDRDITLNVADERGVETQRFQVEGRETLDIDGEDVATVKVRRLREADSERQTWLWFAPGNDYTLVQLVQENDDGRHVMNLESLP